MKPLPEVSLEAINNRWLQIQPRVPWAKLILSFIRRNTKLLSLSPGSRYVHSAPAKASTLAPGAGIKPLVLFSCCCWFLSVLLGPCPPDNSAPRILPSLINTEVTNYQHPIRRCQAQVHMPSSLLPALPKSVRIFQPGAKKGTF